jgi:hypothetical protein
MRRLVGASVLALLCCPAIARAQEAKSPALVKELAQLLDARKMASIAAADPKTPGAFAAALYFPGTQLLVVSGPYAVPDRITDRLAKKDFNGVYMDMSAAAVTPTRLFVMDTFADGLVARPKGDTAADSVERGAAHFDFDGQWKKAKMPEPEYMKNFDDVDAEYARVVQVLIDAVKGS